MAVNIERTPPRRELRLLLTAEIAAVLEAQYQVHNREGPEVVLELLEEWARQKIREARMIVEALDRGQS